MRLDADLAALYGVETRALVQAVKRNRERFPADFRFQLTAREVSDSRSQTVISNGRGGRRARPYVFTEQGVAMLHSPRAIRVNVEIMRAFVRMRKLVATHERRCDGQLRAVFEAIRRLMETEARPRRRIGFGA